MALVVAVATDDGKELTNKHFGDARYFQIYEVDNGGYKLLKVLENNSPEEEFHGDPKKARAIAERLGKEGVEVLVGFAMGPNITRMRVRFVPVISRCRGIEEALEALIRTYGEIEREAEREGEKEVIFLCQDAT